jgi:hypothetical protein
MVEDVGTMTATWTDPLGTVWPLTTDDGTVGWFTRPGVGGWGATSYQLTTDPLARGGDMLRNIRAEPARITWPLHVYGDTHQGFVANLRTIKRAFTSTVHRGVPGTLRVTRPNGTSREIDGYYEDGFGGEGGDEDWLWANPVITLMCPDGYWRDIDPVVESRAYSAGASFLNPYPTVTSAQILGVTTITNAGDVDAWPDWTITGPASVVTAINNTTGESFVLSKALAAGETVVVTTMQPSVRGPIGENLVNALNWPGAVLWGLVPGDNNVSFSVAGASTGTSIVMSYHPRYEGA